MPDLREQLVRCFRGRVCLIGLGNVDCGDDGFGVRLAERLREFMDKDLPDARVIAAGTVPERCLGRAVEENFDHIVFLDAVDFGGEPGATVFLNADEMAARFPQISTHKISLGLLAKSVEANGRTKAWLLGVQPKSLASSRHLTAGVERTLELLIELFEQLPLHTNSC